VSELAEREAAFLELDRARKALAEAETLPEITSLVDRAEVLRVAARKAKLSLDAQNDWAEYKLDAERKAGAMLKSLPRNQGGRPSENPSSHKSTIPTSGVSDAPPKLAEIGITHAQSSAWQRLADLPDEEYEGYKAEARAKGKEITEVGAVRIAKHRERERAKKEQAVKVAAVLEEKANVTLAPWDEWLPAQPICDLLITDPPYSTDVEDVFGFAESWLPIALEKVKPSGRAYVCIGAYPDELLAYLSVKAPEHLTLTNVLVWTYRNTLGPKPSHDYKLNWQAILYYRGTEAPPLDCPEMVEQFSVQDINAPDGRRGDRWHAWQKPDLLAERLIRHSTKPGDHVIDPFAGTGTFVLTAAKLGRSAAGCDISEDNLAIAAERGCRRA
jgi:DNA modification methylase